MPRKTSEKVIDDEPAYLYFGFARHYHKAANLLYKSDRTLTSPIYFLYMHAVELALKAYLRAHDIPVASGNGDFKNHKLTDIYHECRKLGLRIGSDDITDTANVLVLLESANTRQALRYGKSSSSTFPELSWTRDVSQALLQAVEPSVDKASEASGIVPGAAVKLNITVGKPVPKAKE